MAHHVFRQRDRIDALVRANLKLETSGVLLPEQLRPHRRQRFVVWEHPVTEQAIGDSVEPVCCGLAMKGPGLGTAYSPSCWDVRKCFYAGGQHRAHKARPPLPPLPAVGATCYNGPGAYRRRTVTFPYGAVAPGGNDDIAPAPSRLSTGDSGPERIRQKTSRAARRCWRPPPAWVRNPLEGPHAAAPNVGTPSTPFAPSAASAPSTPSALAAAALAPPSAPSPLAVSLPALPLGQCMCLQGT